MHQKKNVATFFLMLLVMLPALLFLAQNAHTRPTSDIFGSSSQVSALAVPDHIQEGDHTTITVEIQAAPNKTYTLGVNVTNPVDDFSTANVTVTTNTTGFGDNSTTYWNDFLGARTDLWGTYNITVINMTTQIPIANTTFLVALTDKLEYERTETVSIRGAGYSHYENVSIDVELNDVSVNGYPKNATADDEGTVNDSWQIPKNTTPGTYTVSITNNTLAGTVKTPPDIQNFEVLGVICQIQTVNLANQTISDMSVGVYNSDTLNVTLLSGKTNATGWIRFNLDVGNYTFKAFWKEVEVGILPNVNATENKILPLQAQLTNIKMSVTDEARDPVPLINLTANYNYTTRDNVTIQKTESFLTNYTGLKELHNMLTNISYLFEARRYDLLFNQTYVEKMAASPWFNITITLPTYAALIHVVDSKNNPLEDFTVHAYEWSSGLGQPDQSETTDAAGNVTFFLSFGKYRVRVYTGNLLLNENTIDLLLNQSSFNLYLSIYNVDFTVAVVDYFGQPLPNALVEVEQKTTVESVENSTGLDGRAAFNGILGGDSRISIYIRGQLCGTKDLYLTNAKQVTFNLSRYVVVAGYAVETSQFVATIAIAILVVVFILALTYKRLLKISVKSK